MLRWIWIAACIAVLGVLLVGMLTREPMVGDEVTHYYMAVNQMVHLPEPVMTATIQARFSDEPEIRGYPHAFLWHYVAAVVMKITGCSSVALQLYQLLFYVQMLLVTALFAKNLMRENSWTGALLALVLVASLPMNIIFSVCYYLDVPATAQILTAFYLLHKRRPGWAVLFLALGIAIKESMLLFVPAYAVWLLFKYRGDGWRTVLKWMVVMAAVLVVSIALTAFALKSCGNATYYPVELLQIHINRVLSALPSPGATPVPSAESGHGASIVKEALRVSLYLPDVIADHPGTLRRPLNWIIYFGGVLFGGALLGLVGVFGFRRNSDLKSEVYALYGLAGAGIIYTLLAAFFLSGGEDARFFLPSAVFFAIPLAALAMRCRWRRLWLPGLMLAALLQSAAVCVKTYQLREVSQDTRNLIEYLAENPPPENRVFMYPEGQYRLFPCYHDWYLGYKLRDLWRGDNDHRIELLRKFRIGAIVIKKNRIGVIDEAMDNLGIYPDFFVREIDADGRFRKVYDNGAATVYLVPPEISETN